MALFNECIKCKEKKSVRPEVYEKRVQKAGGVEQLNQSYLCRKCRKLD